jgi:hypothetical protein
MKVEIKQNVTIEDFKESLHSIILETFKLKEWKRYQNFNVYVSLKCLGDNICVIQPSAFGYLSGNYNPCAFVGITISRKTYEVLKINICEYFIKYCK